MKLLTLYLADLNRQYLATHRDRRAAFWTGVVFILALALVAVILCQAPSLDRVLAVQPW